MMPIGGYFSLELPLYEEFHKDALRLNTGRNCLEYILRARKYSKVYIPYYTCGVILEPFHKLNIPYEYYRINIHLELASDIQLKEDEALIYTNYFGLKQCYTEKLAQQYGSNLIVDNTQAFYSKPIPGIDTFYTCRKFFGVPDGAYLYTDQKLDTIIEQDISYDRFASLLKRLDLGAEAGYSDFREATASLINQPIKHMSNLTVRLMKSIDYKSVAQKRRENYRYLHNHLSDSNVLHLQMDDDAVPMVYPYLATGTTGLKKILISEKVYVPTYWPGVMEIVRPEDWEYRLAGETVFLPIDQRYGLNELESIIKYITK